MYRLEDSHWWFVARRDLLSRALQDRLSAAAADPAVAAPRRTSTVHLLDVGCGTGGTLDRLRKNMPDARIVGLDLEPLALEFCRERGWNTLVQASATALPFADNTFDAAVALDVLEHIPDHEAAAREIARVLAPGGSILITVPAYRALWSRHDIALMHQRRYVAREMRTLLEGAGLTVDYITYTVAILLPLVALIRFGQKLFQPGGPARADAAHVSPPINSILLALLRFESGLHLSGVRLPFGLTVFAIARKPA